MEQALHAAMACCEVCGLPHCDCCLGMCEDCSWTVDLDADPDDVVSLIDEIDRIRPIT